MSESQGVTAAVNLEGGNCPCIQHAYGLWKKISQPRKWTCRIDWRGARGFQKALGKRIGSLFLMFIGRLGVRLVPRLQCLAVEAWRVASWRFS